MKNLIPIPVSIQPAEGYFELGPDNPIVVSPHTDDMLRLGQYLAGCLRGATGFELPVSTLEGPLPAGALYLTTLDADPSLGPEGYTLAAAPEGVRIAAPQPAGVFYGLQTLRQLLPPQIECSSLQPGPWRLEAVTIRDWPRFSWRGAMLDVARHFFGPAEVKHYIDLLAAYKLNHLHLHLSDDQGWRIEVRTWPNLAARGGQTAVDGDSGGFYTQAEYAEIVAFARQRGVTIVPEIDLPGHTNAALASYPELTCDGQAPEPYTGIEVGFSSVCVEKEIVYQFIGDVLQELAALTPGAYLHIGGDEAHSTPKRAYKAFIERVEPLVTARGKRLVGWEEIAECDLSPVAIVQYWKDSQHASLAAQKGHRLVISPASRTYLDMKYNAETVLGQDWAGYIDAEQAYRWDPASQVAGLPESAILGVEAPLWTETIRTLADLEFMAFPRLTGIAEVCWSQVEARDWESYRRRLAAHGPRLDCLGVQFYPDPKVPWA